MDRPGSSGVPRVKILGHRLSRLTLGTAQLGKPYGIANRDGQPTPDHARRIVSTAMDQGVNVFDTAREYGTSESLLGELVAARVTSGEALVVTKLPGPPVGLDRAGKRAHVRSAVEESLRALGLASLPVYLLHRASDMQDPDILQALGELRTEGRLGHLGASTYTPEEAERALSVLEFDVVQVPFNVLDQRLARSGFFRRAEARHVAVFARSIFLQGLLLMDTFAVPPHLAPIVPFKKELEAIARGAGMSVRDVALAFAAAQGGIASLVVGVEREAQLREILAAFGRVRLPAETLEALRGRFEEVPEDLLNPSRWDALRGHAT